MRVPHPSQVVACRRFITPPLKLSGSRDDLRYEYMQFIQKVSNYLTTWTPHSHPDSSRDSNPPSPSSDAIPDQNRRRTEASSVRNAILPTKGSVSPFTPTEAFIQPSPPSYNYAQKSRLFNEHQSLRQRLRQGIPHPRLGMPHLSKEGNSRRTGKCPRPTSDERRLFPSSAERPDPNGVPIVTGFISNKKKQIQGIAAAPFKPVDRISSNARESGPVRAGGKPRRPSDAQPGSAFSPSRTESATLSPERTLKRRRVEDLEAIPRKKRTSDNGTLEERPIESSSITSYYTSMSPSFIRDPASMKEEHPYLKIEEMMAVDSPRSRRYSSENLEAFTQDATRARRIHFNIPTTNSKLERRPEPAQSSSVHVEITNRNTVNSSAKEDPLPPTNGKKRVSESRESPDELQGGATVGPVPKFISRDVKKTITSRAEQDPAPIVHPTVVIPASREAPTTFKSKKWKSGKKKGRRQSLETSFFRFGSAVQQPQKGEMNKLVVDTTNGTVGFFGSKDEHSPSVQIPLQKVLKALVGEDSSRKIRLELSKVEGEPNKVDFELSPSSQSKEDFCSLIHTLNIDLQRKPSDWMDKAFKHIQRDQKHARVSVNGFKRPILDPTVEDTHERKPEPSKRLKVSAALQEKAEKPIAPESVAPEATASDQTLEPTESTKPEKSTRSFSRPNRDEGIEIPVKKYNSSQSFVRSTRSRSGQVATLVFCDDDSDEDRTQEPKTEIRFPRWQRPLVYPRYGKKKAEVDAQDRERLRDNEFLNDNLIGFYMRFLEDHLERCNKEVAKRVYFFNSFFFATLTNLPKGKGKINYAGVEKWTRNVDIFSYDYIVVPINENAHWYVAIMCNLPYLSDPNKPTEVEEENSSAARPPNEVREIAETPEPINHGEEVDGQSNREKLSQEPVKEDEVAWKSLASMSLLDKQGAETREATTTANSDGEWPKREENTGLLRTKASNPKSKLQYDSQTVTETTGSPQKGRKGKKRPTGVNINQPTIITFDSLNLPRSPTISVLREYLYKEAKSKKSTEINKSLVKGMKARDIPLQPNYSDCGLYLLAYVEKFVQDPDLFITKLLKREMSTKHDWPPLRSGHLRRRLHKFLEALHTEQEQLSPEQANQKTMVDQQPICYLLGSSARAAAKASPADETRSHSSQSPTKSKPTKSSPTPQPSAHPSTGPLNRGVKQGNSPTRNGRQQSVINVEQPAHANMEPPNNDLVKLAFHNEVIEVPDSQEQDFATSSPKTNMPATGRSSGQKVVSHPTHADTFSIADSDSDDDVLVPENEDTERGDEFQPQIQVTRTPPGSP